MRYSDFEVSCANCGVAPKSFNTSCPRDTADESWSLKWPPLVRLSKLPIEILSMSCQCFAVVVVCILELRRSTAH